MIRPHVTVFLLTAASAMSITVAIAQTGIHPSSGTGQQSQSVPVSPLAAPLSEPDAAGDGEDIIVTAASGRKPGPGDVAGSIPPEVSLTGRTVRSLGVSTVSEMLNALSSQTGSAQGRSINGRPIVLINGLRTTGFAEVRDLPVEAIARVDIFPEELALRYGYRADQKVVNIVLRSRFRAVSVELVPGTTTDGGGARGKVDVALLRIDKDERLTLDAQVSHQSPLYQDERRISPLTASVPETFDDRPFRSLLARTDTVSVNGTLNRTLAAGLAATLNVRGERSTSDSGIGGFLPSGSIGVQGLHRYGSTTAGHASAMLSGAIAPWQGSVTASYDVEANRTVTDRAASFPDIAKSTTQTSTLELVASGPLFTLPAGPVILTMNTGGGVEDFQGYSQVLASVRTSDGERALARGQASLDIPIAHERANVLGVPGRLNANFNFAKQKLSDFGSLDSFGYGLTWSPDKRLDLVASVTHEEGAPTIQQLGAPQDSIANVQVFDFRRQEAVTITQLYGGNSALGADNRRVVKVGVTLKPLAKADISFNINYTNSRIRNIIAAFPTATDQIETAFPERFARDATGRLISIDARPVHFARSDQEQIRWGLNFTRSFGPSRAPVREAAPLSQGQNGAAAGGEAGGPRTDIQKQGNGPDLSRYVRGFGGPGGGAWGQTRLQFSLHHIWHRRDAIVIRDDMPRLDLLDGSAIGPTGGQPRHEVEARLSISKNGLGTRLEVDWQNGTRVTGASSQSGDLRFSSLATVNLRLFASPGANRQWVEKMPWLRGARVVVSVDNLLNERINVRDRSGGVPFQYQPDILDPAGRVIRLSIRKLFF